LKAKRDQQSKFLKEKLEKRRKNREAELIGDNWQGYMYYSNSYSLALGEGFTPEEASKVAEVEAKDDFARQMADVDHELKEEGSAIRSKIEMVSDDRYYETGSNNIHASIYNQSQVKEIA
jgi:hypothetical protein